MRRIAKLTMVLVSVAALAGCGKEVGRVGFTAPGTSTATVPLSAGEVSFWTDIDIEWQGDGALGYVVELDQGGTKVATATCNPLARLSVKSSWVETNLGASHSRRGNGKMDCSVSVPSGGPTTVRATLAFGRKPPTFTLTRADLVVRQ